MGRTTQSPLVANYTTIFFFGLVLPFLFVVGAALSYSIAVSIGTPVVVETITVAFLLFALGCVCIGFLQFLARLLL